MLLSLRLLNFRCYPSLRWEIPHQGAILLGDNAQGKTSLIEAISFGLSLHTPRANKLDRLLMHGATQFGLGLTTDTDTRRLDWQNRRLQMAVDGATRNDFATYLSDAPPLTWLGNKDIALVQGAAETRRQYLDFMGSQWHPAYRRALLSYKKALKGRNALLKNPRRNLATLRSFSQVLAQQGEILYQYRAQLLQILQGHILHDHRAISASHELVELHYKPSCQAGELAAALHASEQTDQRAGFTTVGPHRDDFLLLINGKSAAEFASEGQQRTLATALQLAQSNLLSVETGRAPILLIDDIFGELDASRRRALLAALPQESQIFITTTQLQWLHDEAPPLPLFKVEAGKILTL